MCPGKAQNPKPRFYSENSDVHRSDIRGEAHTEKRNIDMCS